MSIEAATEPAIVIPTEGRNPEASMHLTREHFATH